MEISMGLPERALTSEEYSTRRTASKPASEGVAEMTAEVVEEECIRDRYKEERSGTYERTTRRRSGSPERKVS